MSRNEKFRNVFEDRKAKVSCYLKGKELLESRYIRRTLKASWGSLFFEVRSEKEVGSENIKHDTDISDPNFCLSKLFVSQNIEGKRICLDSRSTGQFELVGTLRRPPFG